VVLVVIGLAAGGVMVGKASVDRGPSRAQLQNATAGAAAAQRKLDAAKIDRDMRLRDLRAQHQSALARERRWRSRAQRAERRLLTTTVSTRQRR